jgi:hypothetical protein
MKSGIHPQNTFLTVRMTDGSIYITSMLLLPGERDVFAARSSSTGVATLQLHNSTLTALTQQKQDAQQIIGSQPGGILTAHQAKKETNNICIFGFQRLPLKLAQDPKTHNTWTS